MSETPPLLYHFYTIWFSDVLRGIEMEQWRKMGYGSTPQTF